MYAIGTEYAAERMQSGFSELAVSHFLAGSSDLHIASSIAYQHTFVTAQVVEGDKVVPDSGGLISEEHGEILETDNVV